MFLSIKKFRPNGIPRRSEAPGGSGPGEKGIGEVKAPPSCFAQNKLGLLWAGVLEVGGVHLALFLYTCGVALPFPYQRGYGEGHMLLAAEAYQRGEGLYPTQRGAEMTRVTAYPPLFFVLNRWARRACPHPFLFGRLLSLLATVGLGIGVFLLVRQMTASAVAALVAALAWFSLSYVQEWAPQMRVDLPALFLAFWGIYGVLTQRRWALGAAALLFLLALYTKQTMIGGPIVAVTSLVARRKGREAWLLGVGVGAGSWILLLLLNALTHGGFYFNVVTCQPKQFEVPRLLQALHALLGQGDLFPVIGGLGLWGLLQLKHQHREWFAPFLAWLGVSGLNVLACGKIGSDINYFLEISLVLVILLGYAVSEAIKLAASLPSGRGIPASWATLVPVLLLIQGIGDLHPPDVPVQTLLEAKRTVAEIIRRTPGAILSEDVSLLLLHHRPVTYSGFELANLAQRGIWDQSKILRDLRENRVSLVVAHPQTLAGLSDRRYTDEMLRLFRENYREAERIPPFVLLVPRQRKGAP